MSLLFIIDIDSLPSLRHTISLTEIWAYLSGTSLKQQSGIVLLLACLKVVLNPKQSHKHIEDAEENNCCFILLQAKQSETEKCNYFL